MAALGCASNSVETISGFWRPFFIPFRFIRASTEISITGPILLNNPVLLLSGRVFTRSLQLLHLPLGPTFDGQAAALYPDAAPMLAHFSFPNFVRFAAKRQHPRPQRNPG